jgi:hypothetical protein
MRDRRDTKDFRDMTNNGHDFKNLKFKSDNYTCHTVGLQVFFLRPERATRNSPLQRGGLKHV